MKKNLIICLLFFCGFWIVFLAMQHPKIYFNTLGKISKNYYHSDDGTIGKERKPYEKITDENVLNWDGVHYHFIKENGYSPDGEWRFAFFPLKRKDILPMKIGVLPFSPYSLIYGKRQDFPPQMSCF